MNTEAVGTLVSPSVAVLSAVVALVGAYIGWRKWRDEALRRDHVLAWANETISSLQSLALTCQLAGSHLEEDEVNEKLRELVFSTSILIERGRMFFMNAVVDDHGLEKESAYRGYRPIILDPIFVAHEIARDWLNANDDQRVAMRKLAIVCARKFVSLAQPEVGRVRTACAGSKLAGDGPSLEILLDDLDFRREWTRPFDPEPGERALLGAISRWFSSSSG